MATNKRKDAAALFELLDNSTLKVPKNAGSLKIPAWWSSKTNPAPERIDKDLEHGNVAVMDAAPQSAPPRTLPFKAIPAIPSIPVIHEESAVEPPVTDAPAQIEYPPLRLFQPPPVHQTPAATPSIRPPAMTSAEPTPSAAATIATADEASDQVAPRDPRIFDPKMYAQKRIQWLSPAPGAFARLPKWALPVGLGVILVLICGTVIAARSRDNKARASTDTSHPTAADVARAAGATAGPATTPAYTPIPVPRADHAAQVFAPGTVGRSPEQFYVIIARTPSKAIAERNAQFLATHGIDVSTEIDGKSQLYVLISVQGFPSITAAKPYKDRIIEIGHLTPDFKKSGRAWDDAAVLNGLKMTPIQ